MVDQAEIHRKSMSNSKERREAAKQLYINFTDLPDKEQAWQDLIRLTQDKDSSVRWDAAEALGTAFPNVPDKEQAWQDLIRLTQDEDSSMRWNAAEALGTAFQYIPDKEQAWQDMHRLTRDEDDFVRGGAAKALGYAFQYIPDKEQAWALMIRLTQDEDSDVRWNAAEALGTAFQYIPGKEQAWQDLIRLTQDEDSSVRWNAARALGTAFQYIPDKEQAWALLHRLTQDKDYFVRRDAAEALGTAFPHVPDKEQAWDDLHRPTHDEDSSVRASANHSLGRAAIFKATETENEDDFREELKNALKFFENSLKEETLFNPSQFCLPFYRSFYTITFEKQRAEAEVQKYLAEAKDAAEGSKSKEQLLESVENIANALTEAKSLREANLDTIKRNLNTYRQYCDRTADLIGAAEEETPGAARVLRRGLPIIDARIKKIIREKAREVYKQTRGTPLEELGWKTVKYAQELSLQNALKLKMGLERGSILEDWCEYLPADKKINLCEQLKNLPNIEQLEEPAKAVLGVVIDALEYAIKNIRIPRIQPVHISTTQQEIVRIAVVQFCFELTESFPFAIKNEDEVKAKIFSALDITKEDRANIVCLPELCLCEEWISEIKEKYPDMIVIGGSFYKGDKNISPVIMESDVDIPSQPKITPSASEESWIMEQRTIPGDRIYRYETQFGRFVILMCRDFDNFVQYFRNMTDIDMISCPAFNPANDRFHKEADIHVEKIPSYILIANAGLYGGTSIFGRLNRNYFSTLVGGGCKDAGDLTYKLCEVKKGQEGMIIADFNLIYKSIQVPTPSDPNEEIRSVENIKKIPIQLMQ